MILKEKLDALQSSKLIKKTLVYQYLFLIISLLFSIFILMLVVLFCISPSKYVSFLFSDVANSKNKISIYKFVIISTILLFWACVFGIVKSISIIMINTYYKFNIFRALKWFNVYLIVRMKYNMFKKINLINRNATQDIELINYMNSKNLILHGSASINFAYNDYWRLSNDYDFASKSLAPQYVKPNEVENLKLLFNDFVASKYEYKNINVEILYGKYIPARFLRKKHNIDIPNIHLMIAMKIHQLLHLYLASQNKIYSIELFNQKAKNTFIDLCFLLNKSKYWNFNKLKNTFNFLYLSNYLVQFFLNRQVFEFTDNDEIKKFILFVKEISLINEYYAEGYQFIKLFIESVQKDIFIKHIGKEINSNIKNRSQFYNRLIENSKSSNRNVQSFQWTFITQSEKEIFLHKFYEKLNNENKHLLNEMISDFQEGEQDKSIDIRLLLLYELSKNMEKYYAKAKQDECN
ncbi:Hypothetical protein, predicted transmembrane protein [Mycoplasmopsis bovigenitalium 51080]|uniref:Transmembrane protein n=1 Tax=Mycoplasmopsis bovigenitalium 51080 TaxID=1188235 RepID=N9TSE1_9BACT|nr:Hypothetical protein, predicted transmembrane protein [Mycoplasmopsis bovigenitalium 51080]